MNHLWRVTRRSTTTVTEEVVCLANGTYWRTRPENVTILVVSPSLEGVQKLVGVENIIDVKNEGPCLVDNVAVTEPYGPKDTQ